MQTALAHSLPALATPCGKCQGSGRFISFRGRDCGPCFACNGSGQASAPKVERVKTAIGGLSGVMNLFSRAKRHLKQPAIVIGIAGREVRLNVAGDKARVPGSINVVDDEDNWFGRILASGDFEASPRVTTPTDLVDGLKAFAADPATIAAAHGKLTGKCCFCNTALGRGKDKRSASVGFGPDCADHFGLPWGTAATVAAQFA